MTRPNNRGALVDAAASLVARSGPAALTYDALVETTGASKGGILYHFPTKADLLSELVEWVHAGFEAEVQARAAASDARAGVWAHGFVDAALAPDTSRPEVAVMVLIGSGTPPEELLDRCERRFAAWRERLVEDGLAPGLAAVVQASCSGWWAALASGTGRDRRTVTALRSELHALIDADVAAPPADGGVRRSRGGPR